MKKYFTFGLILSLVSGACFAQHPRVEQLLQEKQQKMDKLQKCKGTTKDLKIAGISTLSITAVGVGANIAEAVVLSDKKSDIKDAKKKYEAEKTIKETREAAEKKAREEALKKAQEEREAQKVLAEKCEELSGKLSVNKKTCNVTYAAASGKTKEELIKEIEQRKETFAEEEVFNCRDDKGEKKRTLECKDGNDNLIKLVYEFPVAAPVATTKPAEATKPADKKAEAEKPEEKKVEEKKAEVVPEPEDKKPESVSEQKKIDDAFLKACKGDYKPNPKNNGENSCVVHVKAEVSKADMESIAKGKKLADTVCPNDKVYDSGAKAKMFNCATGTMPNRLYVIFDNVKAEEAPAEKKDDTVQTKKTESLEEFCDDNKDYEYDAEAHGCVAKADAKVSVTSAEQIDIQLDKLDDYWVGKGFECTKKYKSDGDVREYYWNCNKSGVDGTVYTQSVTMKYSCPDGIEFDYKAKECKGAEAPVTEENDAAKAEFAKWCKEYRNGAELSDDGKTCESSTEITDTVGVDGDYNDIAVTIANLNKYWVEKEFDCKLDETNAANYEWHGTCTKGDFTAYTPKFIDEFSKLCKEYGNNASLKDITEEYTYFCYADKMITDKKLSEVKAELDNLSEYWEKAGYDCSFGYGGSDSSPTWFKVCEKGDLMGAYTPIVEVEKPCKDMGDGAELDSVNFKCVCKAEYTEKAGKCVKAEEAPAQDSTPVPAPAEEAPAKTKEQEMNDDAFARMCKEYGHSSSIVGGECTSTEFTEVTDISGVDVALEPLKEYWTGEDFTCEKASRTDNTDYIYYLWVCKDNDGYVVNTAGVKGVKSSICGDGKTFDANTGNCITSEDGNAKAEFAKWCKEYRNGAELSDDGKTCESSTEITDKIWESFTDNIGNLNKYWIEKGFVCEEIKPEAANFEWRGTCTKGDFTAYTPKFIDEVQKLCKEYGHSSSMGDAFSCVANEVITDKKLSEVKAELDKLSEFWEKAEYVCEIKYSERNMAWYKACKKGEDTADTDSMYADTPEVKIEKPCKDMGDGAELDSENFKCVCKDGYKENNGKCVKAQ